LAAEALAPDAASAVTALARAAFDRAFEGVIVAAAALLFAGAAAIAFVDRTRPHTRAVRSGY